MEINTFLDKLQSYHSEQVFNPWRDFDTSCDIGPQAPVIRSANLRRYLELRADAHYLFIAEPWAIRRSFQRYCYYFGAYSAGASS